MSDRAEAMTVLGAPAHQLAFGTGGSILVERCQSCGARELEPVLFIGYLAPVNALPPIGSRPKEQPSYPAELLRCPRCELVQLGIIVDPRILFPPEYPYTSGTTKLLRDNFAELAREVESLLAPPQTSLVVDIGSNDGSLLRYFQEAGHRVRGIEPTDQGRRAKAAGIPTTIGFFTTELARATVASEGHARIVTAANVFAHMEDVHSILRGILELLEPDGVFISESHYWLALVESLQYDVIYHEHLRYYSLVALRNLLAPHGLEVFHAKRIPTHGGSIRVYAARAGTHRVRPSVAEILAVESARLGPESLRAFRDGVMRSKLGLLALLEPLRARGERVYGVGAPSRASTLVTHVGLDEAIIACVLEIPGSQKIGRYMPGTRIPILDESRLYRDQPEWALLLSWHLTDELLPKLRAKGYRGGFIVPLPRPHAVPAV